MANKKEKPNLIAGRLTTPHGEGHSEPRPIRGAANYGTGRLGIVSESGSPAPAAAASADATSPACTAPPAMPPLPSAAAPEAPPAEPVKAPHAPAMLPRRPMNACLAVAMEIPAPPLEEIAVPKPGPALTSPRARRTRAVPDQPRAHVPPGGRVHDLTGDMPASMSYAPATQWGGQQGPSRTGTYVAGGIAVVALVLTAMAAWPSDPADSTPQRASAAAAKAPPTAAEAALAAAAAQPAGDGSSDAAESLAVADVPPGASAVPVSRLHRARKISSRPAWTEPVKPEPIEETHEVVAAPAPVAPPVAASPAAATEASRAPASPKFIACPAGFRLSGTVRQGNRVLANINGRFLGVGDTINGAEVVAVDGLMVEMRRGGEKFFIGIGQEGEGSSTEGDAGGGAGQ